MNEWVQPHRLVSVSAFEEDHPNEQRGVFNVVVLQRGQAERSNKTPDSPGAQIIGDIFNFEVLLAENGMESLLRRAAVASEKLDRATLSTFNWSTDGGDRQAAMVVGWSKTHEDMLADVDRGGCSCAIF